MIKRSQVLYMSCWVQCIHDRVTSIWMLVLDKKQRDRMWYERALIMQRVRTSHMQREVYLQSQDWIITRPLGHISPLLLLLSLSLFDIHTRIPTMKQGEVNLGVGHLLFSNSRSPMRALLTRHLSLDIYYGCGLCRRCRYWCRLAYNYWCLHCQPSNWQTDQGARSHLLLSIWICGWYPSCGRYRPLLSSNVQVKISVTITLSIQQDLWM